MKKFKYIDIFAGCWGLSLWLHNSGKWEWVFAIEKNPDAFSTLKHNLITNKKHFKFPEWLETKEYDINDVLKLEKLWELKGQIDLVVWGPPCQGFSMAWRRKESDERNKLVNSYLKFIELVQPKVLFFENVKWFGIPFKWSSKRPMSEYVLDRLKQIGYKDAQYQLVNFWNYWVPQSRNRVIIVATRSWNASHFFENLGPTSKRLLKKKWLSTNVTLEQSISDLVSNGWFLPSPDSKWFFSSAYKNASNQYQYYMRNGIQSDIPDSHRFANHNENTKAKFLIVLEERLSAKEIQMRFNTKKINTKLLEPDLPSPTLTTLPDDYIHYAEPRILTVREYARIQSFPDTYEFKWKYTTWWKSRQIEAPRYTQIWNAIPPLFGETAGHTLAKLIS